MIKRNTIEGKVISNGKHYLSGVGEVMSQNYDGEEIEIQLFCIDGKTYGAYIDPNDGYRSYSVIEPIDAQCQFTFEPQEVNVLNEEIVGYYSTGEDDYYDGDVEKEFLIMTDAINGKEVLVVGTDFTDVYYPCAVFHYTPENLNVNQDK